MCYGLELSLFEGWPTMALQVEMGEENAYIYQLLEWIRAWIQTGFDVTALPVLEGLRARSAGLEADLQNCHLLFYSYPLAAVILKIYCPFCMLILGR